MHAAVEQGIAEAALAETVRNSGVEKASLDPYVVAIAGEMKIQVDGSGALLDRAARSSMRRSPSRPTGPLRRPRSPSPKPRWPPRTLPSSFSSKLIELGGSSATPAVHDLDRYWRNAHTHTAARPGAVEV